MSKRLLVIKGPDKGHCFVLFEGHSNLFGRGKYADNRLNDGHISRVHCEAEPLRNGKVLLTDLDSAGGTFVNGQKVAEHYLKPGDVVRIGETEMRLEGDGASEPSEAVSMPPPSTSARPLLLSAERLPELVGARLSHYEVGEVIGRGASGLVFKALDFKSDRTVAFKVFWPEFSRDDDEMRRFVRAMKTMLPLRHPNLVTLHGAGKTGPYCWVAMEYVEGESLSQVIARLGTAGMLDWRKALIIATHLGRALEYAHENKVIHRNLTPTNVLIGKNPGITKLGDLMLAKALEGNLAQQITKPGEVLGDVGYLSPERTSGTGPVDGRSDLYGLGALVYAMVTGRPPFAGSSLLETITQIRKSEPVRPKKVHLAIPDRFEAVILKLLAKRPDDRFPTATHLLRELQQIAMYQGVKL